MCRKTNMAASMHFDFSASRKKFTEFLHHSSEEVQTTLEGIDKYSGSETEKKLALDQSLRDALKEALVFQKGYDVFKALIHFSVEAASKEMCSASTPFLMLSDIFDMMTLDKCEEVFNIVEEKVTTWKSSMFYDAGKNYLLRMCNDLIRRLSKSQNTVFCGRIQLFLSRLFPLSEKSALNLMSQFNLDNVTVYNVKSDQRKIKLKDDSKDESMDVEEGEMDDFSSSSGVPIDYNLYRRFWSLQEYFRKPAQCYEKVAWKQFVVNADEVLAAFDSLKLDDLKSQRKNPHARKQPDTQTFFAKYLTSEKLLDLQLSDSNFRRYVLVQFLILFQYLNLQVKFKNATQVLNDDQSNWLKNAQEKVYQLIRETPPEGEKFAATVEHILQREENWNNWKNEGCPSYERETPKDAPKMKVRAKRRRIGDDLKASGGKIIKMGSGELTRLWNINPDNMDACKNEKRDFLPQLDDFFGEAIEQDDPEAMIEDNYKLIYEQSFQWKALRLLARRCPHFFTHNNTPAIPIPKYLELMVKKLATEMPSQSSEDTSGDQQEMKTEIGEEEEAIKETQDEEDLKQGNEPDKDEPAEEQLTRAQLEMVAGKLADDWKKLGTELNFPEDDMGYFEESCDKVAKLSGLKMLTVWMESEPERATIGALQIALKEIGHVDIATEVFGALT
ncbi:THO complex subunit 1-like [Haliotis rufescens]|uniref:THO complex subunit 1-like n=1 Tax=Haliotis rufescens TaxID=6454 RepID=UPI00201ECA5D|nr:THO complex subunit 1-like [Haliotis rufescens]